MSRFLGLAREPEFSPGKVDADRAILEAVAAALQGRGHEVRTLDAGEPLSLPAPGTVVFTMNQGTSALETLAGWERRSVTVVNSVDAIRSTHRCRMAVRLASAGIPTPETVVVRGEPAWPAWLDTDGGWLKRGDVHAAEPGDVVHVRGDGPAAVALAGLRARGIATAVLQRHVPGVVVKFYGVGEEFVSWYPPAGGHAPGGLAGLAALARAAARTLGLAVYGGDCVAGGGLLRLIDVNDWPSFTPCRAAGADAIAWRLEALAQATHP